MNEQEIQDEINDIRNTFKSKGELTRELLDQKGIKSPTLHGAIEIRPGLRVVPKTPIKTEKELKDFIENMNEKYKTKFKI